MRDLLPSSSMIKDLSQEFGIPISQEDLTDGKLLATLPQPDTNDEDIQSRTSNLPQEIQVHQEKYLQWRNNMLLKKNQVHRDSLVQVGILSCLHAGAPRSQGGYGTARCLWPLLYLLIWDTGLDRQQYGRQG